MARSLLTAYLKSKEIYNHLIDNIENINGVYFITVKSQSGDGSYMVIIDPNRLILSCECVDFTIPKVVRVGNRHILICKHILKALEILSKFDSKAKELYEEIKKQI